MLHERMRALRVERKLKQYEVADEIGIVRTTYSGYEQGKRIPDALTLSRIADFYFVSTDYLLGRDSRSTMVPSELLKIVDSLGPDEQFGFWADLIKYARFVANK